jgi:NADH-quinone oxidoreductase subunit L
MYTAIVFLPLLGAIVAGIIALFGAALRHPGGEAGTGPGHAGAGHGGGQAGSHEAVAVPHAAAVVDETHHEPHARHQPAAQGSMAAMLVSSGLLLISAILSWVAFFDVALGDTEAFTVRVFTWIESGQ